MHGLVDQIDGGTEPRQSAPDGNNQSRVVLSMSKQRTWFSCWVYTVNLEFNGELVGPIEVEFVNQPDRAPYAHEEIMAKTWTHSAIVSGRLGVGKHEVDWKEVSNVPVDT
jgi:hypothetical protein